MPQAPTIRDRWMNRPARLMHLSLAEYTDLSAMNSLIPAKSATETAPCNKTITQTLTTRGRHEPGRMNGLEKRYAAHLQIRKTVGEIRDWKFEPLKLKLAPSTFFNPDFGVLMPNGVTELHEAKGHWEDDARVKIKVAAETFRTWFKLVAVRWDKNAADWKFEEFSA